MSGGHTDPLMTSEDVRRISGGYTQPAKQLAELHRQGFWRARRARVTGDVILERAHYEAVCSGQERAPAQAQCHAVPALRPA